MKLSRKAVLVMTEGDVEDMAEIAPSNSLGREGLRRIKRNPLAVVGGSVILFFILVAIFAPLLAPFDPRSTAWFDQIRPTLIPGPSGAHWFGLDAAGRDELSRIIYGARASLVIGVLSLLIGAFIGAMIGLLAGAFGGWVDSLVMRITDIMLSVPGLLLALSIAAVIGQSQTSIIVAVAVPNIPLFARLLRGSMLGERQKDYVASAESVGVRRRSLVMRHVFPNSLAPMLVQASLALSTAIIDASALSFLGLGSADPGVAEWGRMLTDTTRYLRVAPHLAIFPGVAIMITALGFNLFGEAVREALDPKLRR
ncbi:MAG: transporter permease [Ilumatobacteraceae bacterium]|nr:transporter permease [Ilumatobacteraceae bacterium]